MIFTLGAWFVHDRTYQREMQATRDTAVSQTYTTRQQITSTGSVDNLVINTDAPYAIVTGDNTIVGGSGALWPFLTGPHPALPFPGHGPVDDMQDYNRQYTVRLDTVPPQTDPHYFPLQRTALDNSLLGTTITVQATTFVLDQSHSPPPEAGQTTAGNGTRYRVYTAISPRPAQRAAAAVDRLLFPAVPLAVALVAVVAYLATRRALRPVEAMRLRMAEVSATDPRERLDVPDSQDEVAALGTTINATLERLDHAATDQRRFVADASHELRSPLAGLLSGLEVALAHPELGSPRETIATAARQARRLQTLAEDLLLLGRLDATTVQDLPAASVDLAELATELITEYEDRYGDELTLTCHVDGPAPARGRHDHLERALRNLLDNACRHARTRVEVQVASQPTEAPDAEVSVTISNDGPRIPMDQRDFIFQRFARLDDSRTRETGGAGLGLAIAREIAHHHHGTLAAADDPEGACFVLCLQRARPASGLAP
ncbi:sensor histidine kinase [Kitasatospora sp. NPDC101176]|uniref:sensor histidine kinase n=1 Tax=Kitasatospora sp. NPDC101176 TaxID=3364099 RepID=UPI0038142469